MQQSIHISAAIVLYIENEEVLLRTIKSFLAIPFSKTLYIIDNSPTELTNSFILNHPDIRYVFNNKNLGFAKANNSILQELKINSTHHLILNPDVEFDSKVVAVLINELVKQESVVMIAPKVVFPDGSHQYSVRKYPSFLDLVLRKTKLYKKRIEQQEYQDKDLSKPFFPDAIHGCFMLFKTDDFLALNGFDERYFLYMEDLDICKKIDALGKKKLYYPKVQIIHHLRKGSSKSSTLFFYHFTSALRYFFKWL